jgi:hypothetical protein
MLLRQIDDLALALTRNGYCRRCIVERFDAKLASSIFGSAFDPTSAAARRDKVEEVEHILTDLIFIRDGKIVLSATMDEVGKRYMEVMVEPDNMEAAEALCPIDRRTVFGKSVMLFDGVEPEKLAVLGETRNPSIADLGDLYIRLDMELAEHVPGAAYGGRHVAGILAVGIADHRVVDDGVILGVLKSFSVGGWCAGAVGHVAGLGENDVSR